MANNDPLPRIEELFVAVSGGKIFPKLDLSHVITTVHYFSSVGVGHLNNYIETTKDTVDRDYGS